MYLKHSLCMCFHAATEHFVMYFIFFFKITRLLQDNAVGNSDYLKLEKVELLSRVE